MSKKKLLSENFIETRLEIKPLLKNILIFVKFYHKAPSVDESLAFFLVIFYKRKTNLKK